VAFRVFLVLFAGTPPGGFVLPEGLQGEEEESEQTTVAYERTTARYVSPLRGLGTLNIARALTCITSFIRNKAKLDHSRKKKGKHMKKTKQWVLDKKERQRKQGKDVRPDSKYTARKRRGAF